MKLKELEQQENGGDKVKVTILENWNPTHMKKLQRKFNAQGLEIVVSEDFTSAVIEGTQWGSLESISGQVKRSECTDYTAMADLLP